MKIAIYPGSFDPITLGHLNLIKRASILFKNVIVLIAESASKKPLFSLDEKKVLIEKAVKELKIKNVEVQTHEGLFIEYFRTHPNGVCIRGLRSALDFEHEYSLECMNKELENNFETLFLTTAPEYSFVSSTLIKEIVRFDGDVSKFVPKCVSQALEEKSNELQRK